MGILVQKYGGSSLATVERIHAVARRVAATRRRGERLVVVVSARGDTTDALLRLAAHTSDSRPAREVDQLLATGECASAALTAMALHGLGVPAVSLTGPQAGIVVDGRHGAGIIAAIHTRRLRRLLADGEVVVVAGFQGLDDDGDVVTLGRGGSDTTAVALAAELRATRCELYTDVPGVCTADPRIVPTARVLPSLDVAVMAEMSFAGAKVLHPRAVELAAMEGIEMQVRHSLADDDQGTVIAGRSDPKALETRGVVTAITHDLDVCRILIHCGGGSGDLAAEVLGVMARHVVGVDLVARSGPYEDECRMGFVIRRSDLAVIHEPLAATVAAFRGGMVVEEKVGKLSVIGMGLLHRPEYTARVLGALSAINVPTSWIATSQLRTSVVVPLDRVVEAVEALHREFELGRVEDHQVGTIEGRTHGAGW